MSYTQRDLLDAKTNLIAYIVSKMKANDWHAVQDAASDIREIDAKLELLQDQAEQAVPHETDREAAAWGSRLG